MSRLVLALVVRLLPDREWGRAMLAELAALDGPLARLRFASGCVRAVLMSAKARPRILWLCVVSGSVALVSTELGGGGRWFITLVFAVCGAAVLHLTGRPEARTVAMAAGAGGLAWCAAMLASGAARSHPEWALALIVVCVVVAALRGGEFAAIGAAFATCLAIFAVAVGTYAALPRLAPDIAPANATDRLLENQIESTDPYVGELLLAALLGVVVIGVARGPRRLPEM